jgi:four helix bundle protein
MRVLEVARSIVDDVSALCAQSPAIATDYQLRRSVKSVAANIREGFGRRKGLERNQFFRFARGSAEETDEHLRAHVVQNHISPTTYWRLHHRLMVCIKMLNALMRDGPKQSSAARNRSKNP